MSKIKFFDIKAVPEKKKELGDNELVKLAREKNTDQYGEIIRRYQGRLFAYLYRLVKDREETEDLLQDVFIKVFRNLHSFDASRKFSSWIYRIAHNEAVNFIKRRYLKRFISWEDVSSTKDRLEMKSTEEDPVDAWLRKETVKEVDEAINCLPIKYKQVLLLRYYSDKSYEEISDILNKPVNTVGTLISRAKKKLADEIIRQKNSKLWLARDKKIYD